MTFLTFDIYLLTWDAFFFLVFFLFASISIYIYIWKVYPLGNWWCVEWKRRSVWSFSSPKLNLYLPYTIYPEVQYLGFVCFLLIFILFSVPSSTILSNYEEIDLWVVFLSNSLCIICTCIPVVNSCFFVCLCIFCLLLHPETTTKNNK